MADPKKLPKLRACGRLESFSTARHDLGYYNNVAFTATYSLSQPHSIALRLPNLLYPALRKIIDQHPVLSAIPLDEDTKSPYFARLPQIDLNTCVTLLKRTKAPPLDGENDDELDTVLEEQHNTSFKQDLGARPFWRVVVLYEDEASLSQKSTFTCAFIFHHALADGSSGPVFHRALLAAFNQPSINDNSATIEPPDPIVTSPTSPLLPPLEALHPLPLSIGYLLRQQWKEWFPPSTTGLWTGNPIPPSVPRTRFKSLVLSKEATFRLLQLSRKHGVTMTATLQCLIASAIFANIDTEQWKTLHASGMISLRRFLKSPEGYSDLDGQMGNYVGMYSFDHSRQSSSLLPSPEDGNFDWAEALSVKQAVIIELDKNQKDSQVNLLRWISDVHQFFQKKVRQPRQESFELSNVGVVKVADAEKGKWNMGRCVFSQSASFTGPAFFVSAVTGEDGCAVLGFSWLTGAHEEGFMEDVMKALRGGIEGLVGFEP